MYQFLDGKDKHVFGRFSTGTLENPKEHASFIHHGWWVEAGKQAKKHKGEIGDRMIFPPNLVKLTETTRTEKRETGLCTRV
jgi:hypothetical protein